MFKAMGIFIAAALVLSGCAAGEPSFAERVRGEGVQYSNIADDWDEGERLIREGEAFIDQGNDDVRDGRRLVNRGENRQRDGRALVTRGERLKSAAEEARARLIPNS